MHRRGPASGRRRAFVVTAMAVATAGGAWAAHPGEARADDERISLRAEVGAEYDSNVHRISVAPMASGADRVGSPLGRAAVSWSAADRLGQSQDVAFSLLGAGKLFAEPDARSENVGIISSSGAWRIAAGPRTRLGLSAAYYEAIQAGTMTEQQLSHNARDFRSLSPTARIQRSVSDNGTLALGGGYRWFVFKPNRDYDFGAPVLAADYQLARETADGGAEWDLTMGAGAELRRFAGTRLLAQEGGCVPMQPCTLLLDPQGTQHQSQFVSGHAFVTRTGAVLLGAGYAVQWNRSNSYGHSLVRHIPTVRFTAPLPLGIYLAARAELVFVTGADPVPPGSRFGISGAPFVGIEDENTSQVRVELTRDLGTRLQLVGRYSYYASPFEQANQYNYRRQTGSLSLAFTID